MHLRLSIFITSFTYINNMSQSDILSSMQINQALDHQIYQALSSALINLVNAQTQKDVT